MAAFVILGVVGGVFTFLQTTINSRLRGHVQSPFLSSLISFVIGTVVLGIMSMVSSGSLFPTAEQAQNVPWWGYLGGFIGMIVMTVYILLFPLLGGVQTVAMPIFGQIIMSVMIDSFGWFGVQQQSLGILNIIGVFILIAGVVVLVLLPEYLARRNQEQMTENKAKNRLLWQVIAVLAGMMLAIQVAINGNLGMKLGSSVQSAFLSFVIGAVILLLINGCQKTWKNIALFKDKKAPVWIFSGGLFGALYIYFSAFLAPRIGTGSVVVFALLGQMTTSLIVDNFGLLGAVKRKITGIQIAGLVIMLAGVVAIKLL